MKETYTLVLSSQNTTNRRGTTKNKYQYYINWSAFLPNQQNINKKFSVKFNFSGLVQGSFAEMYTLNIDFGSSNVYNQNASRSNYLGLLYPIDNITSTAAITTKSGVTTGGSNTAYYYLQAKMNDNIPITTEYPNDSFITVDILNANISSGSTFNNEYYLTLEFTPID